MTLDSFPAGDVSSGGVGLPMALLGHDLRAALAEMRSSLHLLEGLDLPDALRARVDQCRSVGDGLARLVDQSVLVCLGQASPEAAGLSLVNTAAFLAAQRLRWTGRCAQTGHRFALNVAGDLPARFRVDRTALERVLANLVGNAVNHTPPGAVTMTFKLSGGDLLLVVVEDEGPGFSAAHLAALQNGGELPTDEMRPGRGLGLHSVRRLVNAMGGRCNTRNKTTGGGAISICLPVAAAAGNSPDAAPPPLDPLPDLTGLRLLIAEDCASSRDLVELLARQIGASVQSVETGLAAIAALRREPLPDVLILDDEMPGATGLEVLRWLRANGKAWAALPVLVLTSHIGQDRIALFRAAGATDVIAKPVLCRLELGRAICKVRGLQAMAPSPSRPEAATLDRLRQIAGPEAAAELFQRLEEDLAAARMGLTRAVSLRDMNGIRAHSHVIIALAGTVGAQRLHDDAVSLNSMAHDLDPPERVLALAEGLDGAIAQLLDTVRRFAAAPPAAPADLGEWP